MPVLKIIAMAVLIASAYFKPPMSAPKMSVLYRITESIGRWSMIDIFVIIILMSSFHTNMARVVPGGAAVYFCLVVVLTMLSAYYFDPRLIWTDSSSFQTTPIPTITRNNEKTRFFSNTSRTRACQKTNVFTSIVWLIPLIALIAGGWLLVKDIRNRGPVVTLLMDSAEGIEVNNTVIKVLNVDVGHVTRIKLRDDQKAWKSPPSLTPMRKTSSAAIRSFGW